MRAKRLVKELYPKKGRINHMEALTILAKRLNISLEELYKTNPLEYLKKKISWSHPWYYSSSAYFSSKVYTELVMQQNMDDYVNRQ